MPTSLESLYHGSLFSSENIITKDPDYRPVNRQIIETLVIWKQKLPAEEFEELESLLELYSQAQGMEMTAAFVAGFKAGVAMMIEVLIDG
jgi:hypothetical protein